MGRKVALSLVVNGPGDKPVAVAFPKGTRHLEWKGGPVSDGCRVRVVHDTPKGRPLPVKVRRLVRRLRYNGYKLVRLERVGSGLLA